MKCSFQTKATLLSFLIITICSAQTAAGQVQKRIIPYPEWGASEDDEIQLELVEIKVAGLPVTLGEAFYADDNWLDEMTLLVKNVSGKPIVVFGVGGGLIEGVDEELAPYESFKYGIGWSWGKGFDPEKEKHKGLVFKPGETIELNYENISASKQKKRTEQGRPFCKFEFMSPSIQYEDGTIPYTGSGSMKFYGTRNLQ